MKKTIGIGLSLFICLSNLTFIHANNSGVSELFIENMNTIFDEDSNLNVYDSEGEITEEFKADNKHLYETNDYASIKEYFISRELYILGDPEYEKENDVGMSRGSIVVTYKRKTYYYTMLYNNTGHPYAEFGAYIHCKGAYNENTGAPVGVYAPYFGQILVAPGMSRTITINSTQNISGSYANFNLISFTMRAYAMSGVLGAYVQYNTVTCNISDRFQPVAIK